MAEPNVLSQNQVIRLITQANKREFTLLLGAGASKSSGVPLASEMIAEWRRMAYEESEPAGKEFEPWCAEQPWYKADDEYSQLFEMLFPNERARQIYIEPKVESAFPSWCYLYLASIVRAGYFNVIFTTNFDDLVNDALTMYLGYNPVVCAADSEVMSISITTDRAKIIKLHGDYLFKRLKNTGEDLRQLDPNMESKLKEFGKQCGLVVLGYAGRDQSVMRVLEALLADENAFPNGIYWGLRPQEKPHTLVQKLCADARRRVRLFECPDFDLFMSRLHAKLALNLPPTVLQPYESLREKFTCLVNKATDNQLHDQTIKEHIQQLEQQLNRPWAKTTDLAASELLEAQLALGQRDYRTAIAHCEQYCAQRPDDVTALTTWGNALALQSEVEHSEAAGQAAVAKWTEAVRVKPESRQPRYSLMQYYAGQRKFTEATTVGEDLLKLAPDDPWLRRNLISLYGMSGRHGDAQREVDWLLAREDSADLHALRAAVLEQRGLFPDALAETRKAVELDPDNAWYHFALANSVARLGQTEEAAREYERAIQLDQDNLSFRLQAVSFYSLTGRPAQALAHAQAAAAIEPNSAEARGWLGQLYLALGRFEEAARELAEALKHSPQDTRPLGLAAMVDLHLRRYDDAEQKLRRSEQLNPNIPQVVHNLCLLYWAQGRDQELGAALGRLGQLAPAGAQQLYGLLQNLQLQYQGNREAGLRALLSQELAAMQHQPPPANQPPPAWPPAPQGRERGPSLTDMLRSMASRPSGLDGKRGRD